MPQDWKSILIVGNWKLNGSRAENEERFAALASFDRKASADVRVAACVPFPYLGQARQALDDTRVEWGVQDVSAHESGAFTGETSATMASDFGASFAIVGHSERRIYHRETSALIAQKALRAIEAKLTPIFCVGETLVQREAGGTTEVVSNQIIEVLEALGKEHHPRLVFAYEPVWAIGTGRTATPEQAQSVHAHMRRVLAAISPTVEALPILYGGSVKAANAGDLFSQKDIDGALVGGASLIASEFAGICEVALRVPGTIGASR
jgi:triosephosphate isomerase (TIM)